MVTVERVAFGYGGEAPVHFTPPVTFVCSSSQARAQRRAAARDASEKRLEAAFSRIEFLEQELAAVLQGVARQAPRAPRLRRGKAGPRRVQSTLRVDAPEFVPAGVGMHYAGAFESTAAEIDVVLDALLEVPASSSKGKVVARPLGAEVHNADGLISDIRFTDVPSAVVSLCETIASSSVDPMQGVVEHVHDPVAGGLAPPAEGVVGAGAQLVAAEGAVLDAVERVRDSDPSLDCCRWATVGVDECAKHASRTEAGGEPEVRPTEVRSADVPANRHAAPTGDVCVVAPTRGGVRVAEEEVHGAGGGRSDLHNPQSRRALSAPAPRSRQHESRDTTGVEAFSDDDAFFTKLEGVPGVDFGFVGVCGLARRATRARREAALAPVVLSNRYVPDKLDHKDIVTNYAVDVHGPADPHIAVGGEEQAAARKKAKNKNRKVKRKDKVGDEVAVPVAEVAVPISECPFGHPLDYKPVKRRDECRQCQHTILNASCCYTCRCHFVLCKACHDAGEVQQLPV